GHQDLVLRKIQGDDGQAHDLTGIYDWISEFPILFLFVLKFIPERTSAMDGSCIKAGIIRQFTCLRLNERLHVVSNPLVDSDAGNLTAFTQKPFGRILHARRIEKIEQLILQCFCNFRSLLLHLASQIAAKNASHEKEESGANSDDNKAGNEDEFRLQR